MVGSLVQIGEKKHVIISKFWVGFGALMNDNLQREYYYETFSMGDGDGKRRTAIACEDFAQGMASGNIKILSRSRKP